MKEISFTVPDRIGTKRHIADCMEAMLSHMPLEDITVKALMSAAQVSKATFYRYFSDKYDVITWSFLQEIICTEERYPNFWAQVLENFKKVENSKYYRNALSYTDQNSLDAFIFHHTRNYCESIVCDALNVPDRSGLPEEIRNSIYFFCAGCQAVMRLFLKDSKMSPEAAVKMERDNIPELIKPFFP